MDDKIMIKETALDYIVGWYEGNKKRMNHALHPKLVKRRFVSNDEVWSVDKETMLKLTEEGRGKIDNPEEGRKDITILDYNQSIASVKILSNKFIDYLLLKKEDNHWFIVDVLWDYL